MLKIYHFGKKLKIKYLTQYFTKNTFQLIIIYYKNLEVI